MLSSTSRLLAGLLRYLRHHSWASHSSRPYAATKAASCSVSAPPFSSCACSGASTASMPSTLLSPKYRREASSSASCHVSCHVMATRMSSLDTSCACATSAPAWPRRASSTALAALRRALLCDLLATSTGYSSACGWWRPTRTSSEWMRWRTGSELLWMRATIWGMTASQVSIDTWLNPYCSAASTSGAAPCANHRVNRRKMSCRCVPPLERSRLAEASAMLRKKPVTAGATWRAAAEGAWGA